MASGRVFSAKDVVLSLPAGVSSSSTANDICEAAAPGKVYVWSSYAATTYSPMSKGGNWTYRLTISGGVSANYTIFEAFYLNDGEYYLYSYSKGKWYKVTTAAV